MSFKVVMTCWDGDREEVDEVFSAEGEAEAIRLEQVSNFDAGGEVLHLSSPGDYPAPGEGVEADYEVFEVEG